MEELTAVKPLGRRVRTIIANNRRDRQVALQEAADRVAERFDSTLMLALDRALNTYARQRYHGLMPLCWQRDDFPVHEGVPSLSGQAGAEYGDQEAVDIVRTWAGVFGLVPAVRAVEGTVEFRGQVDGIDVRVWAVTDRAALHQGVV